MTVRDVLDYVIEMQEPAFSEKILLRWLNQIEAEIQTDVLLLAVDGIVQYTTEDLKEEAQTRLIVPAPYDMLYAEYLFWRIAAAQGEAERANNQHEIFDAAYLNYVRFVCQTINPGDGQAQILRYYLTAYQIAVNLGFSGSEKEWVDSLKGANGEPGAGLNIVGQVLTEDQLPVPGSDDAGKGWLVGEGSDALLYIWDGTGWFYKTRLSGKGDKGDPGEDGAPGVGIQSVTFKETTEVGNVYVITLTDGSTEEFVAPHGKDGPIGPAGPMGPAGSMDVEYDEETGTVIIVGQETGGGEGTGDMSAAVYDPDGSIANAGGIAAWIDAHYENAEEGSY